jgi:predicted kinase
MEPQGTQQKIAYLMRGLPSCGKSYTARKLAGTDGVICETDAFFDRIDEDGNLQYDYDEDRLEEAREWAYDKFRRAIDAGQSPVILDRGNSLCEDSAVLARYAADRGYKVVLQEPESEWWQEIRELLKYKRQIRLALDEWAERLYRKSRETHCVALAEIRRSMENFRPEVTIEDILELGLEASKSSDGVAAEAAAAEIETERETETETETETASPFPGSSATAEPVLNQV